MIRPLRLVIVIAVTLMLVACGVPKHPINPPSASIQQLDVLPDGRWKLQIRLENFSDKTVHYSTFKADLHISDADVGEISLNVDMDIPGENADIVETTLSPNAATQKAFIADANAPGGASYELKGTINIPLADKDFKFEHKSRLSPVPGLPNQYR